MSPVDIDIARDGSASDSDGVLLARHVLFRVLIRFVRGSREISPAPTADGLITKNAVIGRTQGEKPPITSVALFYTLQGTIPGRSVAG